VDSRREQKNRHNLIELVKILKELSRVRVDDLFTVIVITIITTTITTIIIIIIMVYFKQKPSEH